ncbi:MAG: DUF998 domain-containing protein [Thermoplasmatales archaeon]|nr:DUF998 domain-containing protein [Thermoplasmatales archaeon]
MITILLIFLTIGLSPWFTWNVSALSDLGVHPYGYIFNSALIFEGLMNTIFILYLYSSKAPRLGSIMILIAGIFLALVGVFTETYLLVHWLVALVYFVVFPLGAIALTFSIRNRYNRFFISTTVLSLVSLAIIMTGVLADLGPLKINNVGLSVFEMSEAILLSIWSIYLSLGYYYQKIKFS